MGTLLDINMVWVGPSISQIEQLCMSSFLFHGHKVNLYAYDKIEGVPPGVNILDASQYVPRKDVFLHMGSYAAFADLFRWHLMVDAKGWYVDTDVVALRPFDCPEKVVLSYQDEGILITPTVMNFKEKNHPLALHMLARASYPLKWERDDSAKQKLKKLLYRVNPFGKIYAFGWGETAGPDGLTNVIAHYPELVDFEIMGNEKFFSIPWREWKCIVDGTKRLQDIAENAYGLHIWNEMWRRNGINKNDSFPKDSIINRLLEKYMSKEIV